MAFFQTTFFSPVLGFYTDINVVIPTPDSDEILNHKDSSYFYDGVKFPVLYLLHGAYGDYSDWARLTGIERYAQKHKIAVVMPSASNSFYQDMYRGSAYETYISKELVQFAERYFPISAKREDRFIGGLSMGGYGCLHIGFKYPENYKGIISLSGAVDIIKVMPDKGLDIPQPFHWDAIFEDLSSVKGSDSDILQEIRNAKESRAELPLLFQSCGTDDFLHEVNTTTYEEFVALGVKVTYDEAPGIHDWDYWDAAIQRALDWIDEVRK